MLCLQGQIFIFWFWGGGGGGGISGGVFSSPSRGLRIACKSCVLALQASLRVRQIIKIGTVVDVLIYKIIIKVNNNKKAYRYAGTLQKFEIRLTIIRI